MAGAVAAHFAQPETDTGGLPRRALASYDGPLRALVTVYARGPAAGGAHAGQAIRFRKFEDIGIAERI